jgi:hypothetical protein
MNGAAKFYLDTVNVDSLSPLVKSAGAAGVAGIASSMYMSVASTFNKSNPIEWALSAISSTALAAGGIVVDVLCKVASLLGFDLKAIFDSIKNSVKSLLGSNEKVEPNQIDSITTSAITQNQGSTPDGNDPGLLSTLTDLLLSPAIKSITASKIDADILKYSSLKKEVFIMYSMAQASSDGGIIVSTAKSGIFKILFSIISWFVKMILNLAGFIFEGVKSVYHAIVGDSEPEHILEENPAYSDVVHNTSSGDWILHCVPANLAHEIISWAQDIYPELKGKDELVKSSSKFNYLVKDIIDYNGGDSTGELTMPKQYTSKKKVVDSFISDINDRIKQYMK